MDTSLAVHTAVVPLILTSEHLFIQEVLSRFQTAGPVSLSLSLGAIAKPAYA